MPAYGSQDEFLQLCVIYIHYKVNAKVQFQHHILCSGDFGHDKDSIFFCNSFVANDLKTKGLHFDFAYYWSNGLLSQFKNQYKFTNLMLHEKDHGMITEWNLFATSHGKRENDGVGGDIKNGI